MLEEDQPLFEVQSDEETEVSNQPTATNDGKLNKQHTEILKKKRRLDRSAFVIKSTEIQDNWMKHKSQIGKKEKKEAAEQKKEMV